MPYRSLVRCSNANHLCPFPPPKRYSLSPDSSGLFLAPCRLGMPRGRAAVRLAFGDSGPVAGLLAATAEVLEGEPPAMH